jgi:hypothetical protein
MGTAAGWEAAGVDSSNSLKADLKIGGIGDPVHQAPTDEDLDHDATSFCEELLLDRSIDSSSGNVIHPISVVSTIVGPRPEDLVALTRLALPSPAVANQSDPEQPAKRPAESGVARRDEFGA